MRKEDLQRIAVAAALNAGLDPALVCAVCALESNWDQDAYRYEPAFFHRYISAMKGLTELEMADRAKSWGLMQVMGQVAREMGFDNPDLSTLREPLNAVTYGCRKLKRCMDRHSDDVTAALLAYNGGGNANYPSLVMGHYQSYAYLNAATRGATP